MRATQQDGSYPRPMLCREAWTSLDGTWQFAHDDARSGLAARWFDPSRADAFERRIEVPFPPESPASGIGARGFHPVVWYRRVVPHEVLVGDGDAERRVLVHFGAVDHSASVWFDGQLVAEHVGGQTPFTADVTDALAGGDARRSTFSWSGRRTTRTPCTSPGASRTGREKPHGIWYERTTGIWQSVWLELVRPPRSSTSRGPPTCRPASSTGRSRWPPRRPRPLRLEVTLRLGDEVLAEASCVARQRGDHIDISVPALRNGQDRARLLWTPEHPHLVDAEVLLRDPRPGGRWTRWPATWACASVAVGGGSFLLNGAALLHAVRAQPGLPARDPPGLTRQPTSCAPRWS